ncbi:MAG: chorismate synthase, partial [Parachlamydiaceae bacterium]|nr:chorismate synthase [Parachlamydiaceae bacterium]
MASNTFGTIFRIMTWGESHGKALGVVIDGCPAGFELSEKEIDESLIKRAPGKTEHTSPRKENDQVEILSGVFEGKTTGTPISLMIRNYDADSSKYEPIKELFRPGHANFTYLEKYGIFDYRGGGRSSGRETISRVAAGAVAKQFLKYEGIECVTYIKQIGNIKANLNFQDLSQWRSSIDQSTLFCPDVEASKKMKELINLMKEDGDSIGGVVEFIVIGLPVGLGDPVFEKIEANLAKALMSIPASKGFEIGEGFCSVTMKGSEHNDTFMNDHGTIKTTTNHSGGTLGGISNGMPLIARVAFKPASSIMKKQQTIDTSGQLQLMELPIGSRHDPCVAIRAVSVVEAMVYLVIADCVLLN